MVNDERLSQKLIVSPEFGDRGGPISPGVSATSRRICAPASLGIGRNSMPPKRNVRGTSTSLHVA